MAVRPGGLGQRGQERTPLPLVVAGGEHLLELVDDQHQPLRPGQRPQPLVRALAGRWGLPGLPAVTGRRAAVAVACRVAAGCVGELGHGVFTRAQDQLPPAVAAGQHTLPQRREQAGPDQGGLAAARGADHPDQARADQVSDQISDQPLSAEEERRVA
jgi:hypothetical protein